MTKPSLASLLQMLILHQEPCLVEVKLLYYMMVLMVSRVVKLKLPTIQRVSRFLLLLELTVLSLTLLLLLDSGSQISLQLTELPISLFGCTQLGHSWVLSSPLSSTSLSSTSMCSHAKRLLVMLIASQVTLKNERSVNCLQTITCLYVKQAYIANH